MKNFYGIAITSPEVDESANVYLITKSIFSDKEKAAKICDSLNSEETEAGIKYYVLEMELIA